MIVSLFLIQTYYKEFVLRLGEDDILEGRLRQSKKKTACGSLFIIDKSFKERALTFILKHTIW
jgi:hypothetical protein